MAEHRFSLRALTIQLAILAMTISGSSMGGVREPILAGSWYPGDPAKLREAVITYLDGGKSSERPVSALIVPHAGYRYSGPTAGKGFAAVRGESFDRVILLGPSHRVPLDGAALPNDDAWRTPLGDVPIDKTLVARLADSPGFRVFPAAHAQEHSLEIEIPFLQVALAGRFQIVPIVVGRLNDKLCKDLAAGIDEILTERTLIVVSTDFTHFGPNYGYVPFRDDIAEEIEQLDGGAIEKIEQLSPTDFKTYVSRTGATICGAAPVRVLLTLLENRGGDMSRLGYARSGDLMADFTNSVSYASLAYSPPMESGGGPVPDKFLNEQEQTFLLSLARETIRARLESKEITRVSIGGEFRDDSPLREVRGLFVTLNKRTRLRGCMGNILGAFPLADGVQHQAQISAFEDPRFPLLELAEFDEIDIEISVLTPPVPVAGPDEVEVGRHGVLLEKHGLRAVFLPQVATEQGWNRDTFLSQLCRKAGLGPDDWRSGAKLEVFEAQVFGEKDSH